MTRENLIGAYLADLHESLRPIADGAVATYIPELAKADPNWFGLAIATVDGQLYVAGDVDVPFTIQSVSKPFLYGHALETLGRAQVLKHVGVEPTGEAFNSTVLDEENNRPYNPMVNAGAIAVSALVPGADYSAKRRAVLDLFSRYAGRELSIDETVFQSERDTGDRNRAIAALMRQAAMMDGDSDEILDLYFSQCSVLVTCRDLALMAASLAKDGVHPITGVRTLDARYVHDVLTVMNSCGMYNYAGQWSYEVGIPAKSGVSGSIAAIIPGQAGIAAFSPRLDAVGNSVRGIAACKRIAEDFGLHVFKNAPRGAEVIRRELRGGAIRSKRTRTPRALEALEARGDRICVLEAQGALFFASAEKLLRRAVETLDGAQFIILDLRRVVSADAAASALVRRFAERCHARGVRLLFAHLADAPGLENLRRALKADLEAGHVQSLSDRDSALEWCEDQLLEIDGAQGQAGSLALDETDIFRGLSRGLMKELEKLAERRAFEAGDLILREGEAAEHFLVVLRGAASVRLRLEGGRSVRLATIGPGSSIGEMALFDGGVRSADVVADEATICVAFGIAALRQLGRRKPDLLTGIYANLTRDIAERLRAANREIRALEE